MGKDWFALGECSGCFEDMTAEKQQALLVLGTDRNCWNSPAKANGINCSASLEERKGMYDAIQRKFARSARSVWHFPEQRRFAIVTIYASMLMSFSGLVVFVALRHCAWCSPMVLTWRWNHFSIACDSPQHERPMPLSIEFLFSIGRGAGG